MSEINLNELNEQLFKENSELLDELGMFLTLVKRFAELQMITLDYLTESFNGMDEIDRRYIFDPNVEMLEISEAVMRLWPTEAE